MFFRKDTGNKLYIGNPNDTTNPLDNAIRISSLFPKINPEKKYIIELAPNETKMEVMERYKKIIYPVIFDKNMAKNALLPTAPIRNHLGYILNQNISFEIKELKNEDQSAIDKVNFHITKINGIFGSRNFSIKESQLIDVIMRNLTEKYPLSLGQLLYVEYPLPPYTLKIHLEVTALESKRKQKNSIYQLSPTSKMEFSMSPAITNVKITTPDDIVSSEKTPALVPKPTPIFEEIKPIKPVIDDDMKKIEPRQSKLLSIDFKKKGIGGLKNELQTLVTQIFHSRALGELAAEYGAKPVKGVLLYGPPGTGKTLIARTIADLFSIKNVVIINGPELKNKWVGESQANLRKIFDEAKMDSIIHGDQSELHVIIFDEIDSLFPKRGSRSGSTGIDDDMTSQILTLLDGVDNTLNNILVIGTTNRKDLLDEALLRENRLALQLEIGLPDEKSRREILEIEANKLLEKNLLENNVNLDKWAHKTRNYSGADITQLFRVAKNFAQGRNFKLDTLHNQLELKEQISQQTTLEAKIKNLEKVTHDDLIKAFDAIKPINGIDKADFNFQKNSFVLYNEHIKSMIDEFKYATRALQKSSTKQLTFSITGVSGTGKTDLAKYLAELADVACIKLVTPKLLLGKSIAKQIEELENIFSDAKRAESSIIILDQLEGILGYDANHHYCNNEIRLQLMHLLNSKKSNYPCIVIATMSHQETLEKTHLSDYFDESIALKPITITSDFTNIENIRPIKSIASSLGITLLPPDSKSEYTSRSLNLPIKQLIYYMNKYSENNAISLSELFACAEKKLNPLRNTSSEESFVTFKSFVTSV